MSAEETKPILQDSGLHLKSADGLQQQRQTFSQTREFDQQQHLIIQPIEFDYKHRNYYGYFALGAFALLLINYLMIKERACQISVASGFQTFDTIQGFHLTAIIIAIIVFVLSYFNFALVIYEFKLLFYASAAIIFVSAFLVLGSAISIVTAPCVSIANVPFASPFLMLFDSSLFDSNATNIFSAGDGVGITVFVFDILATVLLIFTGLRFYKKC